MRLGALLPPGAALVPVLVAADPVEPSGHARRGLVEPRRISAALVDTDGIDRVIHLKTMHLGPDELLVAAKIAVGSADTAAQVAEAIDAAESAVRAAEPIARVIYLEPDIYR